MEGCSSVSGGGLLLKSSAHATVVETRIEACAAQQAGGLGALGASGTVTSRVLVLGVPALLSIALGELPMAPGEPTGERATHTHPIPQGGWGGSPPFPQERLRGERGTHRSVPRVIT